MNEKEQIEDIKDLELHALGVLTDEDIERRKESRKANKDLDNYERELKIQYAILVKQCPLVIEDILEFTRVSQCVFNRDSERENIFSQGAQNVGIYLEQKLKGK